MRNSHDIGEALDEIYGDALLLEDNTIVCLVCVFQVRMSNRKATDSPKPFRPSGGLAFLEHQPFPL